MQHIALRNALRYLTHQVCCTQETIETEETEETKGVIGTESDTS
jgi:hypothetical protein